MNKDVFITPKQFADAYNRTFLPDLTDVQPRAEAPARGKKSKKR